MERERIKICENHVNLRHLRAIDLPATKKGAREALLQPALAA